MMKYAIYIVAGNTKRLVSLHDIKAEALEAGKKIHEELSNKQGTVSCLEEEFDEFGQRIGTKSNICKVWM